MDLAGPKLRTGPMQPGLAALKYRPKRDALGRVLSPARIWLTPSSCPEIPPERADAVLPVPRAWLARLKRKDCIRFTDARGASRTMTVSGALGESRWAEGVRTAYVVPGLALEIRRPARRAASGRVWRTQVGGIPPKEQTLRLKLGRHTRFDQVARAWAARTVRRQREAYRPAQIAVSLPEFFDSVRPGEPIWLDDGKIGGIIRSVASETVNVEITQARLSGERLGPEKGINVSRKRSAPTP